MEMTKRIRMVSKIKACPTIKMTPKMETTSKNLYKTYNYDLKNENEIMNFLMGKVILHNVR